MKCIVPGPNVKVLGRAIHSLAKLGDELYVESTENELCFRTVNSSKTAYASYSFSPSFFLFFSCEKNGKTGPSCQISMRSALGVFKSPMTLERTVESVQIQFNPTADNIVFMLKYKKGVIKTFNTPIIECETLEAYYAKDVTPNSITIQPRTVNEILTNFQEHQDEITWKATKNSLIVKNYSESEDESDGLRTEICVDKNEFYSYKIENETEVTFCLKELRAVLLFSDTVALPLTANFSTSSKPIVFVIKSDIFEVNIVVSTLSEEDKCESMDDVTPPATSSNLNANADQMEDIDDDLLVGVNLDASPEPEPGSNDGKIHHVFHRFFNTDGSDVRKMPGYDVILASDSDSDV